MEGANKSILIWIVIVIAIVLVFVIINFLNRDSKVEYYLTTSGAKAESSLFKDYAEFEKFIENKDLKDTMENKATFKKASFSERYTEEFFTNNNLAVVVVYEDTTKDYIYSIDKVEYNADKTEATITYTYTYGTFADVLASTWYNYMFVDLPDTVESVTFLKNTSVKEN